MQIFLQFDEFFDGKIYKVFKSLFSILKDATEDVYQKLFRVMSRDAEDVMVSSNKEGIDKVLRDQGGYAFFMESTTIEYVTERYCQLQQVGGLLDSKSYGIAVQQGKKSVLYFKFDNSQSFKHCCDVNTLSDDGSGRILRAFPQMVSFPMEMHAVQFNLKSSLLQSDFWVSWLVFRSSFGMQTRTIAIAKNIRVVRFFQNKAKITDAKFILTVQLMIRY